MKYFVGHDIKVERLKMNRKGNPCTRFNLTVFFSRVFKGIVGKICRGEGRSSDNNVRSREKNYYEVIENNQFITQY